MAGAGRRNQFGNAVAVTFRVAEIGKAVVIPVAWQRRGTALVRIARQFIERRLAGRMDCERTVWLCQDRGGKFNPPRRWLARGRKPELRVLAKSVGHTRLPVHRGQFERRAPKL